jgi:vesicle-fusing ATPase
MSNKLKIISVPTDSHGETNMVFVNDHAPVRGDYIRVGGQYVYRIMRDAVVPPDSLCLNFIQRQICHVTTAGDTVDVAASTQGLPSADSVCIMLKLEISHFAKSKTGGTIDYAMFVDFVKSQFDNQFVTAGQQIYVHTQAMKLVVTVLEPEFVKATDGLPRPAAAGGAPQSPAAASTAYGLITRATTVRLASSERSMLQLVNIPERQQDLDRGQVVKDFDLEKLGIGGLRKEFGEVFRRAFASRIFPQSIVKKLGVKHTKGILLYGPPGTGKTLIARKIGEILNCAPPKIVNGPEVFTKWVGGAEENIRKLFADAEAEQAAKGDMSQLHLIIFDEFDAICKTRGSTSDNTGVQDNVVNQLLSKIDGVNSLNNVLLIGMTNRKDRIDDAVLRPGRFEVHVEIGLPDEKGRQEILRIHTHGMRDVGVLSNDVDLAEIAYRTKNFSGAELEGLVRAAQSHAFSRHIDFENPTKVENEENIFIGMHDFLEALRDVKPAFGTATDECKSVQRHGIIDYGETWQQLRRRVTEMVKQLQSSKLSVMSLLIHGEVGTGKSSLAGFTALASEFPYVKFISAASMVGYSELHKCNMLRKVFEDSYKSPLSVVVLDDIERLIELSQGGGRFSNTLLQTLLVLTKAQPPEGKKLLVIGTTSLRSVLETLEVTRCFSAEIEAPLVLPSALPLVSRGLGAYWHSRHEEEMAEKVLPKEGVPITKLIYMIEMATGAGDADEQKAADTAAAAAKAAGAATAHDAPAAQRTVTFERFSEAALQLGFTN